MPPSSESPKPSPGKKIKQLPVKLGKKIKLGLRRMRSISHVQHEHKSVLQEAFPIITSISTTPLFHPIIERPRRASAPVSPPASSRTAYSCRSSFTKGAEFSRDSQESFSHFEQSSLSQTSTLSMDLNDTTSTQQEPIASTSIVDVAEGTSEPVVDDSAELAAPSDSAEQITPRVAAFPEEAATALSFSTIYVEPDVPDPFLIDDESSSEEEEDEELAEADVDDSEPSGQSTATPTPSEILLTLPPAPLLSDSELPKMQPVSLPSPDVNKDIPPPPTDTDTDEDEAPDLYLPGLLLPTMFLPIPNTDPLTILLTKYIYPPEKRPVRDVTGDWKRNDFHALIMTNSWRALARMARDQLVTANPEDLTLILGLWYLRLACLARLRLFNQTSAECTNLFVVLNAIEPLDAREWVFSRILPFELEVMHTRVKYWAGDHMGHLDALNVLLRKCRSKARQEKANPMSVSMWKERGARVCLIIASQLVEMKEHRAATKLLEPLCKQGELPTAALRSSIGRVYLQSGEIQTAAKHFEIVSADPSAGQELKDMNAGLLACAEGDWASASHLFEESIDKDANNFVAVNNLSVSLLGQGKLKEQGIDVLETALKASPSSVVVAEPFLFNLSTLYELRSATAAENKRNLLLEVAQWSGDGLRTTCLKMPTN
ncbi:hypothetical protein H0H87_012591 [Tephrocybe sp. NHM501043]|nr:hypothetical protein H0H87_012591 [Tephrocybe sp. NHM501043]